jgi:predicted TIM-barrel fold metal-dependent hydrolase
MDENSFIDCHCHLFNIVDIPLYDTISGQLKMSTLEKFGISLAALGAGAAVFSGFVNKKLEQTKNLIRFFEQDIIESVKWLADDIRKAAPVVDSILVTPLIMDFDKVQTKADLGKEPDVVDQLERLQDAINEFHQDFDSAEAPLIKFCPFMGLDMRKLHKNYSSTMDKLMEIWDTHGIRNSDRQNGIGGLASGKLLGIKLYPPIKFNPYAKSGNRKTAYKVFYKWCSENQIPITVHCQPGSYSTGRDSQKIRNLTHSRNWVKVIKDYKLKNLRINFAHFGGESEMEEMLDSWRFSGVEKDTWTYLLIKLLKGYENTYADISAFDYSVKRNRQNLINILEKDEAGEFEDLGMGPNKLKDKLMWGSDVPMIIADDTFRKDFSPKKDLGYRYYFGHFKQTINSAKKLEEADKTELIEKITSTNPKKFLNIES